MPFKQKIVILVLVILLITGFVFVLKDRLFNDYSEITEEEIIALLKTNKDGLNYLEKYNDFQIEKKVVLTKTDILEGQKGENFKEVYQDLSLENNRYLKVDLMNKTGNNGLIAILDLKNKTVPKVFGLILLKSEVKAD